jgi:hypothetical protein
MLIEKHKAVNLFELVPLEWDAVLDEVEERLSWNALA